MPRVVIGCGCRGRAGELARFAAEGFGVVQARFWLDDDYGIIRQRRAPGLLWFPELWQDARWVVGSAYVMDAITGGSDDGWWGEPTAEPLEATAAVEYAAKHGVDLLADNPNDSHAEHGPASVADYRHAEPLSWPTDLNKNELPGSG